MVMVMVMWPVVMLVIVSMRMGSGNVGAGAQEHPDRHADDHHGRQKHEVGLGLFGNQLIAELQRGGGQRPHDQRMRQRGAQAQQRCLCHGAPHGDDERRHHRLGVARLESV